MKICYVSPNAHLGGAERIIEILIKHHDKTKFDVSVVFFKNGPLVEKWQKLGAKTFVTSEFRLRNPFQLARAAKQLRHFILKEKFDLVHSHLSFGHFVTSLAMTGSNISLVWFQHGPVGGGIDKVVKALTAKRVYFNSQFTMERQRLSKAIPQMVVYGPVSAPFASRNRENRKPFGFADENIVLLNVARIDRWKGQDFLIDAFAKAFQTNRNLRLILFGDTSIGSENYLTELKTKVRNLNLDNAIKFAGFESDLEKIYSTGDIFVHSSLIPEPLGLSILEAQIRELPVVAVAAGGVKEIVSNSESGLLYETGNSDQLVELIVRLANSSDLRDKLGTGGAKSAQRFESATWTKLIEASYSS